MHLSQMRGAAELIDLIFETVPMMIMVVDEGRKIQTLNKAATEITSRTRRQLVGMRCGVAFECDNSKENEQGCGFSSHCHVCKVWGTVLRTINNGETCRKVEAVIPSIKGQTERDLLLLVSSTPIWSFGKRLALVCVEDITDLRNRYLGSV
jgi:PAS domain-containing protein